MEPRDELWREQEKRGTRQDARLRWELIAASPETTTSQVGWDAFGKAAGVWLRPLVNHSLDIALSLLDY